MATQETSHMTSEQQTIKIAEACGWKNVHWYEDNAGPPILCGDPPPTHKKRHRYDTTVPDYLIDLNVMREAEFILTHSQEMSYLSHLRSILCYPSTGRISRHMACSLYHASAAQKAEAFLKTLGLWKED